MIHTLRTLFTFSLALLMVVLTSEAFAQNSQQYPRLILTPDGVASIKATLGNAPLLTSSFQETKQGTDALMSAGINVPVPKDAGGGFTHEQHKRNYKAMYQAGILFQVTGEDKYLQYVKNMLNAYAKLYPTLGLHPERKEQSPGKLFWQSLNDCVWLVYTIQAYDAVKGQLSQQEIQNIEKNLFYPAARFLSKESAETFDKIHNHGTWAVAAVGMTGYVLNDKKLVQQALYGLDEKGKGGFMAQLDQLFSPDGYYTEGPYYQRYALMPFVVFAQAIANNEPQRKIFSYRDNILLKAINTALQLTYDMKFFPFNDALKEKDLRSVELVYGTNIAYAHTQDKRLLSIAEKQGEVILSAEGVQVAEALDNKEAQPFNFTSMELRDGAKGNEGAVGVLRSGIQDKDEALVMKYSSQGMGHGHFDKLTWLFYDNGNEIIQDYGAARYLNVEAKYGGHYLPENKTWAKQTVSHNTVLVNEQSHFEGNYDLGMKSFPTSRFFDVSNKDVQVMSAEIKEVYPGVNFTRTMAMLRDEAFDQPIILDVFEINAKDSQQQYDLPLYYQGQLINTNFEVQSNSSQLKAVGQKNGYEHLWQVAQGKLPTGTAQVTWLNGDRFYTYSTIGSENSEMLFTRIGSNDPSFNLRNEPGLMLRKKGNAGQTVFVSVLEPHGEFNAKDEYTTQASSQIKSLRLQEQDGVKIIWVETVNGDLRAFTLATNPAVKSKHNIKTQSGKLNWVGPYHYFKLKK